MKLFVWNVASVVNIAGSTGTGQLVSGLPTTSGVLDISEITQIFDQGKWGSIS